MSIGQSGARMLVASAAAVAVLGCDWGYERMIDQPRFEAYEANPYLPGGATLQPPPDGTVPRGAVVAGLALTTGVQDGEYVAEIQVPVDRELLERGRERFGIFCAACHGLGGYGDTEVAENMRLVPPPSLHLPRIHDHSPGRLFAIASFGWGVMPGYAERVGVRDRWAIAAYVQVLQRSQRVKLAELPAPIAEEARTWLP